MLVTTISEGRQVFLLVQYRMCHFCVAFVGLLCVCGRPAFSPTIIPWLSIFPGMGEVPVYVCVCVGTENNLALCSL